MFSSGKLTAGALRSRLSVSRFEQMQLLKFAWKEDLVDMAGENSDEVEEIDLLMEAFVELVEDDEEIVNWDDPVEVFDA